MRIERSPQPAFSIFSTGVSSSEDRSPHHLLTTVRWRTIQNAGTLQCLPAEERALLSFLEAQCQSVLSGACSNCRGTVEGLWKGMAMHPAMADARACALNTALFMYLVVCWSWDPTKGLLQGTRVLSPLSERRWDSVALSSGAGGKHGQIY